MADNGSIMNVNVHRFSRNTWNCSQTSVRQMNERGYGESKDQKAEIDVSIKEESTCIDGGETEVVVKGDIVKSESELQPENIICEERDIYQNITDKQRKAARKHNECFVCKKRLKNFSSFRKHVMRHAKRTKLKCNLCDKTFSEQRYLSEHLLVHQGKALTCKICLKSFANSRSLLGHTRIHTGEKRYKCEVCDKAFTESSTRNKHMAIHDPDLHFDCNLCEKKFKRKSNLNTHIKSHYRKQLNPSDIVGEECPICFKTVTGDLKRHVKYHERNNGDHESLKKHICNVCGTRYYQQSSLQAHMWKHTGKKDYSCDICLMEFTHLSNVKKHMRIHSGERKFVCEICQRAFIVRSALKLHLATHSSEKNFLCDLCSKRFSTKNSLNFHMKIHTGIKPHACTVCSKRFYATSDLRRHEKTHLPGKPDKLYQCEICLLKFAYKHSLKKHEQSHENDRLIKMEGDEYSCQICSKKFSTFRGYKIHQRLHDNMNHQYECELCPKTFNMSCRLKMHIENVHSEKIFECLICFKSFATMERLSSHNNKHSTEKKILPCGICQKTFRSAANLEKHVMTCDVKMTSGSNSEGYNVLDLSQSIYQRFGVVPNGFYAHPSTNDDSAKMVYNKS